MARVPKLTRGIHCCTNFFLNYFFRPASLCCDFAETVYELPFLPNNTESETFFYKNLELCEVLTIYLSFGFAGLAVAGRIRDTGQKV